MQEIIQLLTLAFAALLHGITGVAFSMVGTVALSLMMPLSTAVAVMIIPSLLIHIAVLVGGQTQRTWQQEIHYYIQRYGILMLCSLIGTIIGVNLLLILPVGWLYVIMAMIGLYYAIHGYLDLKGYVRPLSVPTSLASMAFFGLLAGVVGGATNAMSPLLLMFLFCYTKNNVELIKSSNVCYLLAKLVQLYLLRDELLGFNPQQMWLLVAICLCSVLFLYVGMKLRAYLSLSLFKQLIYLVLFLFSIKTAYSGVMMLG